MIQTFRHNQASTLAELHHLPAEGRTSPVGGYGGQAAATVKICSSTGAPCCNGGAGCCGGGCSTSGCCQSAMAVSGSFQTVLPSTSGGR